MYNKINKTNQIKTKQNKTNCQPPNFVAFFRPTLVIPKYKRYDQCMIKLLAPQRNGL